MNESRTLYQAIFIFILIVITMTLFGASDAHPVFEMTHAVNALKFSFYLLAAITVVILPGVLLYLGIKKLFGFESVGTTRQQRKHESAMNNMPWFKKIISRRARFSIILTACVFLYMWSRIILWVFTSS